MTMAAFPPFRAPYSGDDAEIARRWLAAPRDRKAEDSIDALAGGLVGAIRAQSGGLGGIEDFLHAYSLSTREGLALMVLAEALLRVPDASTADSLIEDKLAAGDWSHPDFKGESLLVTASAWTLGVSARLIHAGERPETIIDDLAKRLGLPALRTAIRQAMRLLGSHFVLGQTIEEALSRAGKHEGYRFSFDMLGEGARTREDAERYFKSYSDAIDAIGKSARGTLPDRPGISVKLSALHPRYEAVSHERVMAELVPLVIELARKARSYDLNFTVDAEEADRLELSLDVFAKVLADPSLAKWDGYGLAVQAYQKRAEAVIDWLTGLAQAHSRRLMVRLVKGAYWDTEVKRAQERGLADYPVFTRKAMTDLSYEACAAKLIAARPHLFPQFATHNALTVASVIELAGGSEGYEFQRLHGMGEALYEALRAKMPGAACRIYAPVGGHRDLLAYLVRRLLENGANSSFVSVAADPAVPVGTILQKPRDQIGEAANARHPRVPLPRDLYGAARKNSPGVEFGDAASLDALLDDVSAAKKPDLRAALLIGGQAQVGASRALVSPVDGNSIGSVIEGDAAAATAAMQGAAKAFPGWSQTSIESRAAIFGRAGDLLEKRRGLFIALMQREGGKTLDDAVSEWREAIDYCRYYAANARETLRAQPMPGPTGERNELHYRGRGVFVCISPWNFPLAIFLGQVSAALVAGNAVVAKPAEQTPLIAYETALLLHEAGVPQDVLHLLPGDGKVGAALVSDPRVAGVAFTGSTEVGRIINRTLAAKEGPIVPLIAETGGINAMIVDATALPEQVADDVITSAFRSAGQRCSALRLLCVQGDIAHKMIKMIAGAARELKLGDPGDPSTHVGPVIDLEAKERLDRWISAMGSRVLFRWDEFHPLPVRGLFVPPAIVALDRASDLKEEVFGPILHVVRWKANGLDALLDDIAGNGTGLTLGVHSRIDTRAAHVAARLSHGNVYINRSMIGAVVGTQPFGGHGLSGTGPKAGGPNYLRRFVTEQTVTTNTAAAGGNATLLAEMD